MRHDTEGRSRNRTDPAPVPRKRLRAIICRTGQDNLMDTCMMMIGRNTDVEQVPTMAEAMERCLNGGADILFVNMFPISAADLTALSMFRDLAPGVWVVALASEELKHALLRAGIADEVLAAGPPPAGAPRPGPRPTA